MELGVVSLTIGFVCRDRKKPGQFSVKVHGNFRLESTSFNPVSPANLHSTNFSTITITYEYHPGLVH
jgi:hypothetical protein